LQRLTGAHLILASGGASGDGNIVPFSKRIRTFQCGDGESDAVATVSGIFVYRILLSTCLVITEVPEPSGYVACGFVYKLNLGSFFARYAIPQEFTISGY
jgi:hypothetical protein